MRTTTISDGELDVITESLKAALVVLGRIKKRRNMAKSFQKAKDNGSLLGRRKKRNDESIHRLRMRGLSIRAIAKIEGVSSTSVQRSLKASRVVSN